MKRSVMWRIRRLPIRSELFLMDWKEILAKKVDDGVLEHEEFTPKESVSSSHPLPLIEVIVDRKGRKGKSATIAFGFDCDDARLKEIASKLKTKLSTGGSARGGEILIQGEHKTEVENLLKSFGYKVK